MRFFLLAAVLSSGLVACGGACTDEFRFGLTVSVVDSQTGAALCNAVVTATDGSYSETLKTVGQLLNAEVGNQCVLYGAGERAGTYTLDAKAEGRESRTTGIIVFHDACHVVPRDVTLKL